MTDQQVIVAIVRDVSPSIEIGADDLEKSLFDLGLDSLDHATILLQVEEKFGVKIPDEVAGDLASVSSIAALVARTRGA